VLPDPAAGAVPEIDAAAFEVELRDSADVVVLDTRDREAFAAWHVDVAAGNVTNVPESEIEANPEEVLELVRPHPRLRVICTAGKASRRVAARLGEQGVEAVSVRGGMIAWSRLLRADEIAVGEGFEVVQFRREARGCLSYLVTAEGEAMAVDPAPGIQPYLDAAEQRGVRVAHILDTHVHADHVSGARDLASETGASLLLSEAAVRRGVRYAKSVETIADGTVIPFGSNRRATVIALPGHTSDMIGLQIGRTALLSGDSLFADSVARPDLELGDAGAVEAARRLHRTLRERVASLPDSTLLLPGHYAGGRRQGPIVESLGSVRSRVKELTLGEDEFVARVVLDMPPKPANYASIIAVNLGEDLPPDEAARLEIGTNNCAAKAEWAVA